MKKQGSRGQGARGKRNIFYLHSSLSFASNKSLLSSSFFLPAPCPLPPAYLKNNSKGKQIKDGG